MLQNNTSLKYSILTILSTGKKRFESMGRLVGKSGSTISRILPHHDLILSLLAFIACRLFSRKKQVILVIDDTLIKKIYSRFMQGSGLFYDTAIGRRILAYKLLTCGVTDGKYFIPLMFHFLYSKEVCPNPKYSKDSLVKQIILTTKQLFEQLCYQFSFLLMAHSQLSLS